MTIRRETPRRPHTYAGANEHDPNQDDAHAAEAAMRKPYMAHLYRYVAGTLVVTVVICEDRRTLAVGCR